MDLSKTVRSIPDFPKKGILFRDITTLLSDAKAFGVAVDNLAGFLKEEKVDYVVCAEARGFIFGGALAYKLRCGFVPVRKQGKLPGETYRHTYSLEYGEDSLEMHRDAFLKGASVVILDDLLATGGTALALVELVKKLDARISAITFLIELADLEGRQKLKDYPVYSVIQY